MTHELRIAVVEGDAMVRDYLEAALRRLGQNVVAGGDGRQFVALCKEAKPDLILADLRTGDVDGPGAAAASNRRLPIPAFAVSARHPSQLPERAPTAYIMVCLNKPAKRADMETAVSMAVYQFGQLESLRQERRLGVDDVSRAAP